MRLSRNDLRRTLLSTGLDYCDIHKFVEKEYCQCELEGTREGDMIESCWASKILQASNKNIELLSCKCVSSLEEMEDQL